MNEQKQKITMRIFSVMLAVMMAFSICTPATAVAAEYSKEKAASSDVKSEKAAYEKAEKDRAEKKLSEKKFADKKLSGSSSGYISNEYIEAYILYNGHYTMGTVAGDPNSDTDDNKKLLYGHPESETTETLVRIDETDYWFDYYVYDVDFSADGLECVATALIDGVEVKQILTIMTNPYSGIEDLISIRYTYRNTTSSAKQVGIRIMLDTMLGDNDGAPFRVNGEDVVTEKEFFGNDIPQYWQSFDSLEDPRVVSTGFFFFNDGERPDKVQFADWPDISDYPWGYEIDEYDYLTGDSAVAAYFNPRTLPAGANSSVVTYYGISGFSAGNSDLDGELGVRITAPSDLYGSEYIGGYLNNPFDVTVYTTNLGERTLENVKAVLSLENAPQLSVDASQATTVNIGDMNGGTGSIFKWTLRAIPQTEDGTANYTVKFYEGTELLKTMELVLNLHSLDVEDITRTVTFDLNGAEGVAPETQRVLIGGFAEMPENPEREGYIFGGWYSNPNCTGTKWFNVFNLYKGNFVTENITLYAKWVDASQKLIYGEDTFSFINTYWDFFDDYTDNYQITGDYYDIFLEGLSNAERAYAIDNMESWWGGSCFGMSAVLSMVKAGQLDVDFFQGNASKLYDLEAPAYSDTVFNLINFYHLMQFTDTTAAGVFPGTTEAENNEALIEALDESPYPIMVCFYGYEYGTRVWGHAVVAYDYEETEDSYLVSIWDPNDSENSNTLIIDKSDWSSEFEFNYDDGASSTEIISFACVEDGIYNYKNIQDELIGLGYDDGEDGLAFSMFASSESRKTILNTNYASFVISDSEGNTAVVENGDKVSGTLDISVPRYINEIGEELNIQFIITGAADAVYTVSPSEDSSIDEYFTAMSYNDETDGFYSSVKAEDMGTVVFNADGTVETEFSDATVQKITVAINKSNTPWFSQTVEGSSKGFTVAPSADGTEIDSRDDTSISVSARDSYNKVSFNNSSISSNEGLKLAQSENDERTAVLGDEEQTMGYSLTFITSGGSAVTAQTDIASGDTAEEPENPTRGGFVFAGWYTSADCLDGEEWSFDTPITEDTTVYAKWLVDNNFTHNVTFKAEGFDDVVITVLDGGEVAEEDIPAVPEKLCCTGMWDITDLSYITSDVTVRAVYEENHSYPDEPAESLEPTCTEDGYYRYVCEVCEDIYDEEIDELGHDMSDFVYNNAPTCDTAGDIISECQRDDCDYFETREIPATHTDEDLDGICDECEENASEFSFDETVTFDEDKNVYSVIPTESEILWVTYSSDEAYCYLYDSNFELITYTYIDGYATCELSELTAGEVYYIFVEPDFEYGYEYPTDVTFLYCSHDNTTEYDRTEATCSEPGREEGEYCNDCDTWLWGGYEYYESHDIYFVPNAENPVSCTESGYVDAHCRNCDFIEYEYNWYDARHIDTDEDSLCDACGMYTNKEILSGEAVIYADEITYVEFVPEVSGTYIFESTFEEYNDTYGYLFDADKVELSRDDDDGENGNFRIEYECTEGETYYLGIRFYSWGEGTIPYRIVLDSVSSSHQHKLSVVKTVNATCKAEGTKYYECACGKTATESLSKTAHTSDKGTVTKQPTYTSEGVKTYKCTVCNAVLKTEKIAKLVQPTQAPTKAPAQAPTQAPTQKPAETVKVKKPAKVKIKTAKSKKKKTVVVTWAKVKTANGYQVAYSTSKKFIKKATKTKLVKKAKTVKTTLKKLKSGKKYFIKLRAYKTVSGKKLYGAYSKVKTVKVK